MEVPKTKKTQEQKEPKKQTPTFLLELPLVVNQGQAKRLKAHLEAGRQFYNAVLSEGQQRLRHMRATGGQSSRKTAARMNLRCKSPRERAAFSSHSVSLSRSTSQLSQAGVFARSALDPANGSHVK